MSYVKVIVGTLIVVAIAVFFAVATVQIAYGSEDQRNQVSDWCDDGMKFDDLDGPSFTVPDPPQGATWTLLVIKAGQVNTVIPNPIPGQTYFPSNEQDVSHAILCYQEASSTTTTSSTTTSTTTTTTPTTTTTAPTTSTSSSVPPTTTSTTQPDSSSTTVPPSVSTTAPPVTDTTETPVGGIAAGGGVLAQHLVEDDPAPGGGFLNAMTIIGLSVAVIALALAAGTAAWRSDA